MYNPFCIPFRRNCDYINVTLILLSFLLNNEENESLKFIFPLAIPPYFCSRNQKQKSMKMIAEVKSKLSSNRRLSDLLFILWAGGAALLSYSLVYALRKPFTAATFDGIEAFGLDYKVLVTIIQIVGYLIAKFVGIKLI